MLYGLITLAAEVVDKLPKPPSIIPSHTIAVWLLRHIDRLLCYVGLGDSETAEEIIYVAVIVCLAIGLGIVVKYLILYLTRNAVRLRHSDGGKEMLHEHVLSKCAHIIPPLFLMAMIPFAFNYNSPVLHLIMRGVGIYALIAFAVGLNAILTYIFNRYNQRDNRRQLPLKGILNVGKGIVWIITVILCVSVLIDKSPAGILAGLTAFAAALMLIFKDSILGFVAGIQMAENDMLHVGDWIVVPGTPANGTVLDMSLSTVKVQNWDNTIITVPPYTLISGAFQNWRGMSESGVRRIMQNFTIDSTGIEPLTKDTLDAVVAKYPILKDYVAAINEGRPGAGAWMVNGGLRLANGTLETNLGLFRTYLCAYLIANPHISSDHRVLVQLTDTNIYGYTLQIWCWSATTDWNAYESIQSAVMEHVAAVIGDFGLSIYDAGSEAVSVHDADADAAVAVAVGQPGTNVGPRPSVPGAAPDAPGSRPV